ncbi:MAG TPA: pectinesterase family protein [Pyrinomonadaceae bacterium]
MPDDQQPSVSASDAGNSVEVQPGGRTFPTINAALASITDNKLQKQYILYVGPGTYNEKVQMKPYVTIQGAGRDVTIITQPAASDAFSGGTVMAASNCTLANVTVSSLGGHWGSYSTAVSCSGAVNFDIDNATLIVDDQNQAGVNQCTLNAALNTFEPPSQIRVSYCLIKCTAQNGDSGAAAAGIAQESTAVISYSKLIATASRGQSFGVITAGDSHVTIDDGYVEGGTFALNDSDRRSIITANKCQINGPVSEGVVVNN